MGLCVGWGAWGVDRGWMPLPTRPQRYCDPASLVLQTDVFSIGDIFLQTFVISKQMKPQWPVTSHLEDFLQSFQMVMDFLWFWPTVNQFSARFRWTLRHLGDETSKTPLQLVFFYTAPFFTF